MKYFKRLTYVAAKLTHETYTVGSAVLNIKRPSRDRGSTVSNNTSEEEKETTEKEDEESTDTEEEETTDTEEEETTGEKEEATDERKEATNEENSSVATLDALRCLANSLLCKNKIVAVVATGSIDATSVTVLQEPSPSSVQNTAGNKGRICFAKNPRRCNNHPIRL